MKKLVRDKIPYQLREQDSWREVRVLSPEQYQVALGAKLQEEVAEFLASGALEELADILEVVHALAAQKGVQPRELETIREEKAALKGKFEGRFEMEFEA